MVTTSILDSTIGAGLCEGIHPGDGDKCLEPLDYPMQVCEVCNTPVIWVKNSDSVKRKRKLSPADDLGKKMLKLMKINNFQTAAQRRRWQEFIEIIPEPQIRETWESCGRNSRKFGWLQYTLNKLNWLIDHGKVEQAVVEQEFDSDAEFIP